MKWCHKVLKSFRCLSWASWPIRHFTRFIIRFFYWFLRLRFFYWFLRLTSLRLTLPFCLKTATAEKLIPDPPLNNARLLFDHIHSTSSQQWPLFQIRRSLMLNSRLTTYIPQVVKNGRYLFIISGFSWNNMQLFLHFTPERLRIL